MIITQRTPWRERILRSREKKTSRSASLIWGSWPAKKTLEVSSLDVNVYGDEADRSRRRRGQRGNARNYTMKDAQDGTFGWYAEVNGRVRRAFPGQT